MPKSPILDTVEHVAGYGVGALNALTSLRGGGFQNYLLNRQKALADPAFRATLIDSPFTSGTLFQGLTEQPAAAPGAPMPAAGSVAGPSDLAFLAAQTPGGHSIPTLSPLSAEQQVGVQAAQGIVSGLQSTDPAVRGLSKVAGKIPLTGDETTAVVKSGQQLQGTLGQGSTVGVQVPGMPVQIGSPYNVAPLGEEEFPTPEQAIAASNAHGWGGRIGPTVHGGWKPIPPPSPSETLPPPPGTPPAAGTPPAKAPADGGAAPAPAATSGPVIRGTVRTTAPKAPAPAKTSAVPAPAADTAVASAAPAPAPPAPPAAPAPPPSLAAIAPASPWSIFTPTSAYAAEVPPGATVQQPAAGFDRDAVVPHVVVQSGDTADTGGAVGYPSAAPAAPGLLPLITVRPPAAERPAAGAPVPAATGTPQMPAPAPVLPGIPTEPKSGQPLETETHQYTGGVTLTYHAPPRGSTDEQGLMRWAGITDMAQAKPENLAIYNAAKRFLQWQERMDTVNAARIATAPSEAEKAETERLHFINSAVADLESDPRFDTPEKRAHYVGWMTYPTRVIQEHLNSEDAKTIADFRRLIAPLAPTTFEPDARNPLSGPDLQYLAPLALNPYDATQFESNLQGLRDVSARQIAFHGYISGLARDNPAALDDPQTLQYFNDQYRQAQQQQSAAPAPAAPPAQAAPQPATPPPTASRPWAPTATWSVQ